METQKKITDLEYEDPLIEKNSVKIEKNSRGFNYSFKVVDKKGLNTFDQIDKIHDEIMKRVNKWSETEVVKTKKGNENGEPKKF